MRINSSQAKKDRMKKRKKKEKERTKVEKCKVYWADLEFQEGPFRFVSFRVCEILCDFDFWFFKRERGPIRFRFVS